MFTINNIYSRKKRINLIIMLYKIRFNIKNIDFYIINIYKKIY